jgi:ArsR family metal-binding transcriptional regulator
MKVLTTFPNREEFEKARARLGARGMACGTVSPEPAYRLVGVPALVVEPEGRAALTGTGAGGVVCAGWVDYRPARIAIPQEEPPAFEEDVFGVAAVVVLAPCVADATKIRFITHLTGDLAEVFPYMNAEMKEASYNARGPTFTFMEGYRLISMYPRRIAVAKADEIVDGWRTLERIRRRANETWARRREIEPSDEMRQKPPALEIFKRLPRTNCGACGEATCLAFAVRVHAGEADVRRCRPVFEGEYERLKDALLEVCRAVGAVGEPP